MELRLVLHVLGVAILVAASLTAMADQSGRLVGLHEIPPFVTERVEIVPTSDSSLLGGPTDSARPASAG